MTDGTDAVTTIHIVLMILLAAVVVVGIAWGVKAKRARVQGEREFVAHAEEAGVAIDQPVADEPAPAPVAPMPPPLADQPVVGTPPAGHPDPMPVEPLPEPPALADEPIAAAVVPEGAPATLAADAAADAPSPASADAPLTTIKGLGPKVAARLDELGVTTVGQLAALDDRARADLDAQLGPFTGRMARDRWAEQARLLATGDRAGFEAAFGKLG